MKKSFLFTVFCLLCFGATAQSDSSKTSDIYQIRLQDTIRCIQQLEYEDTGEPIKGILDGDGKTIYLENYRVNKKVRLKVVFTTGREEEILRSPCSVELSTKTVL